MSKAAEKTQPEVLPLDAVMRELRFSENLTPARTVELLRMLPRSGVTHSSAEIIRELRGPLPNGEWS